MFRQAPSNDVRSIQFRKPNYVFYLALKIGNI